jgi:hypothetical protein
VLISSLRIPHLDLDCPVPRRVEILSLIATWKNSLGNGAWPILCVAPPVVAKDEFPNEKFASVGYIGAKHYDEGLVADFLSAYAGLIPWNAQFRDEAYLDSLLAPGRVRPPSSCLLSPEERRAYRAGRGLPL